MASGSGGGAGGCNKRHRRVADDDGDGETSRRNKRCAGGQEDYMYEYDDEEAEETEGDAGSARDAGPRYVVLTEDDVRARQEADTAKVAEVLSVPTGVAAVLLRHFKWRVGRVQEEWFSDDRRVRAAVGLPADVPDARGPQPRVCGICFDLCPAGRTRSVGCSHYYCDGCWRGYVAAAVRDGPRCLSLRCPDPSCSAPVVRELVDAVAAAADKARYARFWLRSYVEESGGRLRWCGGGAGCTRSVEFLGDDAAATDVFCGCRRGFCWTCGEEAHQPVSCGTVRAWLAKNASDSATANWVVANTKRCPACRRPIEKNQGCNHMTCGAPCRHQFCWLCLDPWDDHRGCSSRSDYRHRRLGKAAATDEQETRRRQAKASLDRYLYHYERWAASGKSLHKALADMDELEHSELERMARAVDLPVMELWFVTEAYRQIADGRRVLRWAHAYAYFLEDLEPERHAAKRGLFDDLQSEANRWLECLHASAELQRRELFGADDSGGESTVDAKTFLAYREKVANLTGVTRKFLGNLVRAFETNLPEVVTPASEQIVNEPTIGSQTVGLGGIVSTPATVIVEPAAIEPIVSAPRFLQVTPISNVASQGLSAMQTSSSSPILHEANAANDSVQEHKPIVNPVRPGGHGSLLSNPSQFRLMNSTFLVEATTSMGLPNIWATPLQVQMLNMMSNGVTSTPSVNSSVSEPGQPIGTQQMVQRTALGSFGSNPCTSSSNIGSSSSRPNNMAMDQRAGFNSLSVTNNSAQQPPPKYVKIWEGSLVGQRQGQPVFICKLESWRGITCKTSIADWPETMQIVRLIAQEHMTNKQYVGKTDFLIFQTLNEHGFLQQLQEKKLCAVIQLPSQTLLLSISDKAGRMIGMLFRENTLVFKPQVLIQSSPMQQEKLQQQLLQLQQQEQPELLQQQQQEKIRQLQQLLPKHQQQHMHVSTQNMLTQQLRNQQNLQQSMQHQQQLSQFMQQQQHQQQPSYQMVGTESGSTNDARE